MYTSTQHSGGANGAGGYDPRRAITEQDIHCLICGKAFRQLTNTHLRAHGTTAQDYKRRFGYNLRRPLQCLELQELYRRRAVETGLAARIRRRPILDRPELRRLGGLVPLALEGMLNRREAQSGSRRAVPPPAHGGKNRIAPMNDSAEVPVFWELMATERAAGAGGSPP